MKAYTIIAVLAVIAATYMIFHPDAQNYEMMQRYQQYLAEYGKSYNNAQEFEFRFQIFMDNVQLIDAHNAQESTFTMGVNQFADWTNEEYRKLLTYVPSSSACEDTVCNSASEESVDWVKDGAVNPVQDQGLCSSSWAFSAVAAIEASHFKATGELLKFSEQQFIDCSVDLFQGCNGGSKEDAMIWAEKNELCLESEYKYTGSVGVCKQSECTKTYSTVSKCHSICSNNPDAFKAALEVEPLSVAVDASSSEFKFYSGGVLDTPSCGTSVNHNVLAVGYNTNVGSEYFISSNSWGSDWGENGIFRITTKNSNPIPKEGVCGIYREISYPESQ